MLPSIISILLLGLLVIVHELGHYLIARWAGVRILRFSIGFGPRLLAWTRGHTEYAISAIPLGGYVKMAGEQARDRTDKPWDYCAKSTATRASIIVAGPCVNYLVAYLSLWELFLSGFPELLPVVGKVVERMPAQEAGFHVGDRIAAINGQPVPTWEAMTKRIYASAGVPLQIQFERDGKTRTARITPQAKQSQDPFGRAKTIGLIGISPSGEFRATRVGPVAALGRTMQQLNEWTAQTMLSFWSLLTGRVSLHDSVTGPIGIVYLTSEAVKMGLTPLLFLISLFSLSLAIFNLFPIPILDGGHLLFLAIERLRGKPVSLNVQERSAQISFVFLVLLVLVICINDVNRFGLVEKVVGWVK